MVSAIWVSADLHFLSTHTRKNPPSPDSLARNGNERMSFFWRQFYPQGPDLLIHCWLDHTGSSQDGESRNSWNEPGFGRQRHSDTQSWVILCALGLNAPLDIHSRCQRDIRDGWCGGRWPHRLLNIIINRLITPHYYCHCIFWNHNLWVQLLTINGLFSWKSNCYCFKCLCFAASRYYHCRRFIRFAGVKSEM